MADPRPFCIIHEKSILEHWCRDCNLSLCATCLKSHQAHEVTDLKKKVRDLFNQWLSLKTVTTKRLKLITENVDQVPENKVTKLKESVSKLNEKYEEMAVLKNQYKVKELEESLNLLPRYIRKTKDSAETLIKTFIKSDPEGAQKRAQPEPSGQPEQQQINEETKELKEKQEGRSQDLNQMYARIKAKLVSMKERYQRDIGALNEQLQELQTKVQKLESLSINANAVTFQIQEQLSHMQRQAHEALSQQSEKKKRVRKAKSKVDKQESQSVDVNQKQITSKSKNIMSEAAYSLSSLSSD